MSTPRRKPSVVVKTDDVDFRVSVEFDRCHFVLAGAMYGFFFGRRHSEFSLVRVLYTAVHPRFLEQHSFLA